jgi:crossover junction endodeoxyribonuclease RuvC
MRVIAIDPGYDRCGISIMEYQNGKEVVIHSDCIQTEKKLSLPDRLLLVGKEVEKLIITYSPNTVAIETLFFNKNVKTAIGVAQVRGIIMYIAQLHKCTIYEFGPQEIKIAVTGHGGSDKKSVLEMTKRLIPNLKNNALDDEYDAIAVGITCLAQYGRK